MQLDNADKELLSDVILSSWKQCKVLSGFSDYEEK